MQLLLIACLSQSRWSGAQDLTLFLWAGSINSCRLCTLCISDQASWSCLHIAHQHRPVLHSITPMCHALIRLMPIPAHIPQTHMHWSTQFRHSLRSELSIAKCHHDLVGRMSDHIIWSTMVTYDQVLNGFLVQQVVWNWFHIRIPIQVDVLVISYKWACSPGLSFPISATCLFVSRSGAMSDQSRSSKPLLNAHPIACRLSWSQLTQDILFCFQLLEPQQLQLTQQVSTISHWMNTYFDQWLPSSCE